MSASCRTAEVLSRKIWLPPPVPTRAAHESETPAFRRVIGPGDAISGEAELLCQSYPSSTLTGTPSWPAMLSIVYVTASWRLAPGSGCVRWMIVAGCAMPD